MEKMDYWRLCDELSVIQTALLIVGEDPAANQDYIHQWESHNRPDGYDAVMAALQSAIFSIKLRAKLKYDVNYSQQNEYNGGLTENEWYNNQIPNWHRSTIRLDDIKTWLKNRGINSGFFFPYDVETDEFLDRHNTCFAPKLAAAVSAWKAVSGNDTLLNGKTPKQALLKWLRENAKNYGLTDEEGKPNEQGIEEIAKVANWNIQGGAAKTPKALKSNPPTPKKTSKNEALQEKEDRDSDPF